MEQERRFARRLPLKEGDLAHFGFSGIRKHSVRRPHGTRSWAVLENFFTAVSHNAIEERKVIIGTRVYLKKKAKGSGHANQNKRLNLSFQRTVQKQRFAPLFAVRLNSDVGGFNETCICRRAFASCKLCLCSAGGTDCALRIH